MPVKKANFGFIELFCLKQMQHACDAKIAIHSSKASKQASKASNRKNFKQGCFFFCNIHVWHSLLAWRCGICGSHCCCFESMNLFSSFQSPCSSSSSQLLPRSRPSQPSYTRLLTSHPALTIVPTSLILIGISNELSLFSTSRVGPEYLITNSSPFFNSTLCNRSLA